jgi:ABC-type transport system substrate-binding protein
MKTKLGLLIAAATAILLVAACTDAGRSGASAPTSMAPAATPTSTLVAPTPTPITVDVASPADAAALVIATDPRFEGAIALTPDVIGASKWWEATALAGGGYHVTITVGWGDCPSGCIDSHVWDFEVSADGQVTLLGESGDPIPSDT